MHGVWYAAIGAAFVLGLVFLRLHARRGAAPAGRHGPADPDGSVAPRAEADVAASGHAAETADLDQRRADAERDTDQLREAARTEAEQLREAARVDADAARAQADAARTQADAARLEATAARAEAQGILTAAREQVAELRAQARRDAADDTENRTAELTRAQAALAARMSRLDDVEARLDAQETRLHERAEALQRHGADLAATKADLDSQAAGLDAQRQAVQAEARAVERELERVAGLSAEDARAELLAAVEATSRRDAATLVRSIEGEARAEGTERARRIVVEAVQRVASAQTAEAVVSVLHLPAEEMKGRIIGREGRNIRAFESVTGVNVIIDDTPEAVLLSCFDPVRRETARLTLDKLVQDGRIHPHRIEEAYEQSQAEVEELCLRAARDAVADVGVGAIDERLMPYLGRLKYRTSYGQNVLAHLVETAHVAGVMAAELGVEPVLVKRSAFLHDIGKALTHEVEGSHAIVGAQLLRKYGEDEAVAHAVEAHHNEVQPRTVEAVLTQAADTCSAARPGARRESVEAYVKRLARIEEIGAAHDGVDKVFAMQAGREVRVMVAPTEVDDLAASVLARDIAKQIEDELTYPGQIRVTVVRESRSTEIAH
ncbi:ribonuclease Y [uncultured Jatrophihabitans sp.]|uniref:ribonuclease Y n=1 Tax=uncultured Jatrophihabitans sp. TaxID=1610747 RepID=UPI0035CA2303